MALMLAALDFVREGDMANPTSSVDFPEIVLPTRFFPSLSELFAFDLHSISSLPSQSFSGHCPVQLFFRPSWMGLLSSSSKFQVHHCFFAAIIIGVQHPSQHLRSRANCFGDLGVGGLLFLDHMLGENVLVIAVDNVNGLLQVEGQLGDLLLQWWVEVLHVRGVRLLRENRLLQLALLLL